MSDVTLDNLKVTMSLDDGAYTVAVMRNGQVTRELTRTLADNASQAAQTEAAHQSIARTFRHVMVTIAAMRFAVMDLNDVFLSIPRNIIKMNAELERTMKLMEGLSTATTDAGRKAEAQKGFDYVMNMAREAPFKISGLTDAFVKLRSAGLDPMDGSLHALVQGVAKFGGNDETLHRAAIAIQQMAGKGVISMEELRQQLGEAVPTAMRTMATSMGMSMAELVKHVSKGEVEAKGALSRMFTVMEMDNRGAAANMMTTWTGIVSQIQTELQLLAKAAGDAGFFKEMKSQISELRDYLRSPEGAQFARNIGQGLASATRFVSDFAHRMIELKDSVITFAEMFAAAFVIEKWLRPAAKSMEDFHARRAKLEEAASLRAKTEMTAEVAAAEKAQLAKVAAMQQEFDRKMNLAKVWEAEYAAHLARIRALETRSQAATGLGLSPAVAQGYQNRIDKERELAFAATRRAEVMRDGAKVTQDLLQKEREHTVVLMNQGAKLVENAGKVTMFTRVASGMGAVVAALGGPFWATVTVLTLMIPLWSQWASKGEEAIKKVKDALNAGTATKKDKTVLDDNIATLKNAIVSEQNVLDSMVDASGNLRKGFTQKEYDLHKRNIEEHRRQIEQYERDKLEVDKQVYKRAGDEGVRFIEGELQRREEAISRLHVASRNKLRERIDEINKDPNAAKNPALQKELTDLNAKLVADYKKEAQDVADSAGDAVKRIEGAIAKAKAAGVDPASASMNKLDAALVVAQKNYEKAREFADRANKELGTAPLVPSKQKGAAKTPFTEKHEDPLNLMLQKAQDDLNAAEDQLKDIDQGTITFDTLYQKALAKVDLARRKGQLNQTVLGPDGVKSITINRSDSKDNNQTEADREAVRKAMEEFARNEALAESKRKLAQVKRSLASDEINVNEALQASEERLARGGDKIKSSFDQQSAALAKYRMNVVDIDGALKEFDQTAANLKFKAATTDINNFISDLTAKNEELRAQSFTNEHDRNQYEFDAYKDQLNKQFNALKDHEQRALDLQRQAILDRYGNTDAAWQMILELEATSRDKVLQMEELFQNHMSAKQAEFMRKNRTGFEQMVDAWKDSLKQMDDAKQKWANDFVDTIMSLVTTGKVSWTEMIESWLADILRMQLKKTLGDPLNEIFNMIFKNLAKLGVDIFSGAGGIGYGETHAQDASIGLDTPTPFAKGGIMSKYGELELRKYANGGVATSPQLALFGEGSKNEAYVPLPDGRSIPVTITGGLSAPAAQAPSVVVNVINQSGKNVDAEQKPPRFDGKQMVLDIVLSEASRPGGFRDGMRQAMRS